MRDPPTDAAEVKIFGERNTGTNALKVLIESNSSTRVCPSVAKEVDRHFAAKTRLLGHAPKRYRALLTERYIDRVFAKAAPRMAWKHTATYFDEIGGFDGCPVIVTTRHPASWLLALFRRPYHALRPVSDDFFDFLRTPWVLVKRDNLARMEMLAAELWGAKSRSHLLLMEQLAKRNMPFAAVRFEDFVVDQSRCFVTLRRFLADAAPAPAIVERSTKDRAKDYRYYQAYYGEERWREEISQKCAEFIERSIDWSVACDLGYSRP